MKTSILFDIVFVLVMGVLVYTLTYLGHESLLSQYAIIHALASYFVGKFAGRKYAVKKTD